jgi:hypothetical protein
MGPCTVAATFEPGKRGRHVTPGPAAGRAAGGTRVGFAGTAALLPGRGTLVHPGYLFDAEQPAVALSLFTAPEEFAAGVARLVAALQHEPPGDGA